MEVEDGEEEDGEDEDGECKIEFVGGKMAGDEKDKEAQGGDLVVDVDVVVVEEEDE